MTIRVQLFLLFSMDCGVVGTGPRHYPCSIIMLLFPEVPLLTTRGTRCPTLDKEFATR